MCPAVLFIAWSTVGYMREMRDLKPAHATAERDHLVIGMREEQDYLRYWNWRAFRCRRDL